MLRVLLLLAVVRTEILDDPFCTMRNPNGACMMCAASFSNNDNQCQKPDKPVTNCMIYVEGDTCVACLHGFLLEDGKCSLEKNIKNNCLIPLGKNRCALCEQGYFLNKGQCGPNSTDIQHCLYYGMFIGKESCLQCEKGYTVSYKKGISECVDSVDHLENCTSTMDGEFCTQCNLNYYRSGFGCLKSPTYHFANADWFLEKTAKGFETDL